VPEVLNYITTEVILLKIAAITVLRWHSSREIIVGKMYPKLILIVYVTRRKTFYKGHTEGLFSSHKGKVGPVLK
jgi:hypothetical protein